MMQADRHGFLIGQQISDAEAERLLGAIKGDTGKILKAIHRQGQISAPQRTAVPVGRSVRAPSSSRTYASEMWTASRPARSTGLTSTTALPGSRGGVAPDRLRDARGRFAAGAGQSAQTAQAIAAIAGAEIQMAHTAETARRDGKADDKNQPRKKNGQFGDGEGGGKHGHGLGGMLARGAGMAMEGGERVDPLLGAVGEIKSALNSVKGIATPIGRQLLGMVRSGKSSRKSSDSTKMPTWAGRMLGAIKGIRGGGSGGDAGGGLMSALGSLISSIPGGGLLAGAAGAAILWLKMATKMLPLMGTMFEAVDGVAEDNKITSDTTLTSDQRMTKRAENVGRVGGAIGGAMGGAALGSMIMPGVGTVIGAGLGGLAGSEIGKRGLGAVSSWFESGKQGPGAVSIGDGDAGGASYGTHQLSSKAGTLQKFLGSSGYGAQFAGLQPGTPDFDAKWKQVAGSDPAFGQAQQDFIGKTHFDPQMAKLQASGIDLSGKGDAVKQAVFSTAVQFGGNTDLIQKALAGRNVDTMSDADTISAIQDYKAANNASRFRSSSPAKQASTLQRAGNEKAALLGLVGQSPTLPGSAVQAVSSPSISLPLLPNLPTPVVVPPAPQVDAAAPTRLNSGPSSAPAAPSAPPSQDMRDRTIAHIVTGGIGAAPIYR